MSSKRLQDMPSRHLEGALSVTIFFLPRRLEEVFKTSWKTKNQYAEDVLKTSSRHVLKTSCRPLEDQPIFAGLQVFVENGNLSFKTISGKITSYIIKQAICFCFEWYDLFFCTILRQLTVSVKNAFSGFFFRKQKGAKVFH